MSLLVTSTWTLSPTRARMMGPTTEPLYASVWGGGYEADAGGFGVGLGGRVQRQLELRLLPHPPWRRGRPTPSPRDGGARAPLGLLRAAAPTHLGLGAAEFGGAEVEALQLFGRLRQLRASRRGRREAG